MSRVVRIKSESGVPITMRGREGIIKSTSKDEIVVQFYDNSIFVTYKKYVEEVKDD